MFLIPRTDCICGFTKIRSKEVSPILRIIIPFNRLNLIAIELSLPVITDIHGHALIFHGLTKQPNI